MGSGMNLEQAKTCAEKMSYSQAVYNALCGYGVPYKKATKIKLNELLDVTKNIDAKHAHKKGKWVKVTNGRSGHECNICHEYAPSYQNGDEYLSRFCPNCGTNMMDERGDEE